MKANIMLPKGAMSPSLFRSERFTVTVSMITTIIFGIIILAISDIIDTIPQVRAINIRPDDFERLIMPCYLSGSSSSGPYGNGQAQQYPSYSSAQVSGGYSSQQSSFGRGAGSSGAGGGGVLLNNNNGGNLMKTYQPIYAAADTGRTAQRDGLSNLGQQIPRANTIDNFIALVSKIEASNPRLANDLDQFIKTLLGRFRLDDFYYNSRTRLKVGEQTRRSTIQNSILSPIAQSQAQEQSNFFSSGTFPENILDHDEKCSMYFMLSHFIDKTTPLNPPLASVPVTQLAGPLQGQLPPNLQAAGTGYPGQSANSAFGGSVAGSSRYPGPSAGFGSPAMANIYAFGSGVSNSKVESSGNNPYGMNVIQPISQIQQNYNNLRNAGGPYSGTGASNYRQNAPRIEGNSRSRDERQALEYGVVTVANQENAAIVLNRVLMGILAASTPPQTIRQLSSVVYAMQPLTSTPKLDDELDPLYAVTLSDLWAVSAIIKPDKEATSNPRELGVDGKWNDTICPTLFHLERSSSIKFTTAELLGGLDGFGLGMLRRQLMGMRRPIRLSDLLRMYYSRDGFKRQFAEVGVCRRESAINSQMDEIRRQAEIYLRLLELTTPKTDGDIANYIQMQGYFVDKVRQAASQQYAPPEVCLDTSQDQYLFGGGGQLQGGEQCEISKADVAAILDASPQANEAFMSLVVIKLAQKLGLSRLGSALSVLTNQEDRTSFSGPNRFNAIVRNSTNTAEIGCAFAYDSSRSYSGGQITEASRLVEMFERALEDLDSEYLIRQKTSAPDSYRPSSYVSALLSQFGGGGGNYGNMKAPRNTGGSKVIIWFNYDSFQQRPNALSSSATNWYPQRSGGSDQNSQERFDEAKRDLRENFRGASILAVTTSRENSKDFVYDEQRDVFNDIPQGSSSSFELSQSSIGNYQSAVLDPSTISTLNGPADQLVNKLLARICEASALFQYPTCFKEPSNNVMSVGFISPGRRQNWMMAPKTFFSSQTVRMVFKVEGGRLRVCFGRMAKPDESAAKNPDQRSAGMVPFISAPSSNQQGGSSNGPITSVSSSSSSSSSGSNYYTGKEYGICKDVAPGQEIDFIVDDPCYKESIADCEPFYFVIKEVSQGELDMNYMCRDEGCKTLDQAKFVMTHTGVECNFAFKAVKANWFLIMISILTALGLSREAGSIFKLLSSTPATKSKQQQSREFFWLAVVSAPVALYLIAIQQVSAQQAGVYDYGQGRAGEKRGSFTPPEVLSIILLIMAILAGLALTLGLCYYLSKRTSPLGGSSSRQGLSFQKASANEIAQAMGQPNNFEPILACTVAFIVVGILMMVTGGVICLIYFTEITPPNFDSNYHRYVGSSMPRIVGPLLVAFGGLLSVGDFIVIGLTVQQYQRKKTHYGEPVNDSYQIETEAKSILS